MEALVITLREGIEAALVLGLILTYLNRAGQQGLKTYVYAGLALAAAASLLAALLFSLLGIDPENEVMEGILLAVAGVLVVSLVVWMWRASQTLKRRIERRLQALESEPGRRRGWGLLAFSFFMVFREGVEIVLFLAAISLTESGGVVQVIGGLAGLALALAFGVLLVRGSLRLNPGWFFRLTGLVLMILAARLLAGSIHEFSEVRLLPSAPLELAIIGFLVKDSTSLLILVVLILIPVLAIVPGLKARPGEEQALPGESTAQRRTRVAQIRRSRFWGWAAVAVVLIVAIPLSATAYQSVVSGYRPGSVQVASTGGEIRIPLEDLQEGRLTKFSYWKEGKEVRFLAVRRSEEDVATALDACSICPPVGFYQEGGTVICDNCNAPLDLVSVGLPGGCNPVPLGSSLSDGALVISESDL